MVGDDVGRVRPNQNADSAVSTAPLSGIGRGHDPVVGRDAVGRDDQQAVVVDAAHLADLALEDQRVVGEGGRVDHRAATLSISSGTCRVYHAGSSSAVELAAASGAR